jgi:hypothetical protein
MATNVPGAGLGLKRGGWNLILEAHRYRWASSSTENSPLQIGHDKATIQFHVKAGNFTLTRREINASLEP